MAEAQNTLPPPHSTLYCIRDNSILLHTGKGGGELNQRESQRGDSSQSWVENTKMTDCISTLYKLLHIPAAKSLYRQIFLDDDIFL